jgi:23S rRNA pseudouridine2605 synthase
MAEVRLQKFLAECGVGSRRKMEEFIVRGRVRVNGQVVTELGRKIDPDLDRVEVNRKPIQAAPKGIMLLNKPRGVVSTLSDPEGRRSIADFLTKKQISYFPVGRLDWESTGLMVLTNDGEVAERLMHPRFGFERVYEARVEGTVSQGLLDKLARGIKVSDGIVRATAEIMSSEGNSTWVQVRINEGRNRIVRRIFDKLGHSVMKLKRTVYGPFKLGRLQVGQVRVLTQQEYELVRRKVMNHKAGDVGETGSKASATASRDEAQKTSARSSGRSVPKGSARIGRVSRGVQKPKLKRVRRRD